MRLWRAGRPPWLCPASLSLRTPRPEAARLMLRADRMGESVGNLFDTEIVEPDGPEGRIVIAESRFSLDAEHDRITVGRRYEVEGQSLPAARLRPDRLARGYPPPGLTAR